jgi:two-component system phosphate regulon sensor histidine kinase PhoR
LRISKLEKRELDIEKESSNAEEVIEDAIEHVNLILEDRQGKISTHFELCAKQYYEVHFTNVINILVKAIKYLQRYLKLISTLRILKICLIKVKDNGLGMSKVAQKS